MVPQGMYTYREELEKVKYRVSTFTDLKFRRKTITSYFPPLHLKSHVSNCKQVVEYLWWHRNANLAKDLCVHSQTQGNILVILIDELNRLKQIILCSYNMQIYRIRLQTDSPFSRTSKLSVFRKIGFIGQQKCLDQSYEIH